MAYVVINLCQQHIRFDIKAYHCIQNEGIKNSPIFILDGSSEGYKIFNKRFLFDLSMTHYRKLIRSSEITELSKIMGDINGFLKNNGIASVASLELSEVIVELAGNAGEHCDTDCLVDIDLTTEYINTNTGDGRWFNV